MEKELENIDSTNDELEIVDSPNDEAEDTTEDADEQEEYTPREKQYYNRIKTLEKKLEAKVETKEEPKPQSDNMSSADMLAVMRADVHEDDMERVERFAKSEGQSIKEALSNPELKAILGLRTEERTTANASNTSNSRRGTAKVSDDVMISNATKGKLPEDDAGIEALIAAKRKAQ